MNVSLLLLITFSSGILASSLTPSVFSTLLKDLVKKECALDSIALAYTRMIQEGKITLEKLQPLRNVKEYASKLFELFSKKAVALEEVVQSMEEEASKYPWNPHLRNISYIALTDEDSNLERHHYFNIPVNQTQSGVYLPVEVYVNDTRIARQVDWTSNCDYIFRKQNGTLNLIYFASVYGFLRIYPRFVWTTEDNIFSLDARRQSWYTQYTAVPKDVLFLVDTSGSMHGQALHLMNISLRLLISNLNRNDFFAVAKFPTDKSNPQPSLLFGCLYDEPCYNSMVQATSQNKQHFIQNIFRLVAENGANYDEAIMYGLKLMSTFSSGKQSTEHCNKIIVLISDADIYYNETTVQVLKRYRQNVRLFTYSLSMVTTPGRLEKIATEINGTFAHIPVIGAMSNFLRHFTKHAEMRRPIRNNKPQKMELVVHQAVDVFPPKIAEELGPMASLTLALYNRSQGQARLLGIVGTDVSAREMIDLLQTYVNSPTDYAFILDNNGYVIFHPLVKSYSTLSSHFVDTDLIDIEAAVNPEMLQVRKNIIDQVEGVTVVEDFGIFIDEVHAHETARTYAHAPIPETNYSICIVTAVPRDVDVQYFSQVEKLIIPSDSESMLLEYFSVSNVLMSVDVIVSPTLAKCRTPSFSRLLKPSSDEKKPGSSETTQLPDETTTEHSINGTDNSALPHENVVEDSLFEENIDASLFRTKRSIPDLLLDDSSGIDQINKILKFTKSQDFGNHYYDGNFLSDLIAGLSVITSWKSSPLNEAAVTRSVFFTSGLGFLYPLNSKNQEFVPDMISHFANSSIWQRVLDSYGLLFWVNPKLTVPTPPMSILRPILNLTTPKNDSLVFEVPNMTTPWPEMLSVETTIPIAPLPSIVAFSGVEASHGSISNTFAVAGLTLSETYLQGLLSQFPSCEDVTVCYLLDDAAFIIAVNKPTLNYQVGHFLGYADSSLMVELLTNFVYSRIMYYDYQSICESSHLADPNCTSPSIRIIPNLLNGVFRVAHPDFWIKLISNVFSLVFQFTRLSFLIVHSLLATLIKGATIDYVTCVKSSYRYYATDGANFVRISNSSTWQPTDTSGAFSCSLDCTRFWSAASIPETNLKLVTVDPECNCDPVKQDWKLTPTIARDINICENVQNPRYRRPLQSCTPA